MKAPFENKGKDLRQCSLKIIIITKALGGLLREERSPTCLVFQVLYTGRVQGHVSKEMSSKEFKKKLDVLHF